jgi:aldose 1-epimerase
MIILSNDISVAEIDPVAGGLIASCKVKRGDAMVDLLYAPAEKRIVGGFRWHGCWPLIPFANRAFGGIVLDDDGPIRLPTNDPAGGARLHGFSALAAWDVITQEQQHEQASLTIRHLRLTGDDPYRYEAHQTISLGEDGALSVAIAVTNRAKRPLPYGIGLHPWFPAAEDTTFEARAMSAMRFGPGYRPIGHGPVDSMSDWNAAGRLKGAERVANFLDWDGFARIETASRGIAVEIEASETLRKALLWTPGDADFVCFEPQSHALGAPSEEAARVAAPLKRLAPGETLEGSMLLRLVDI